jgi:hypothetical protein
METIRITGEKVAVKTLSYSALNQKLKTWSMGNTALVYMLLTLNALDILTTHSGLQSGAAEANVMMDKLFCSIGEAATYVLKISFVLAAAVVICRLGKPQALKWLNLTMALIVVSNLIILTQSATA